MPKKGDIIIFKSNGDSHIGIVDYTSGSRIYYIDGNNTSYGNGNKACVHYSNRTFNYKGFTSVIVPNYKTQNLTRNTYNDVFASVRGKGYSLNQARESASSHLERESLFMCGDISTMLPIICIRVTDPEPVI